MLSNSSRFASEALKKVKSRTSITKSGVSAAPKGHFKKRSSLMNLGSPTFFHQQEDAEAKYNLKVAAIREQQTIFLEWVFGQQKEKKLHIIGGHSHWIHNFLKNFLDDPHILHQKKVANGGALILKVRQLEFDFEIVPESLCLFHGDVQETKSFGDKLK
jgi:hypothetical protein